jgi:hypothetical protein
MKMKKCPFQGTFIDMNDAIEIGVLASRSIHVMNGCMGTVIDDMIGAGERYGYPAR